MKIKLAVFFVILAFFMNGCIQPSEETLYMVQHVSLVVDAPMSTAEIVLGEDTGQGKIRMVYTASSPETGIEEETIRDKISFEEFQDLGAFIEQKSFRSFEENYIDESLTDATTYSLTITYITLGGPEFADAFYQTVNCKGECPAEIVEIRDRIIELWGREILEIGV